MQFPFCFGFIWVIRWKFYLSNHSACPYDPLWQSCASCWNKKNCYTECRMVAAFDSYMNSCCYLILYRCARVSFFAEHANFHVTSTKILYCARWYEFVVSQDLFLCYFCIFVVLFQKVDSSGFYDSLENFVAQRVGGMLFVHCRVHLKCVKLFWKIQKKKDIVENSLV